MTTPAPPTADELRRHARILRRAAGQLEAAARHAEAATQARRVVVQMLAPVLQWGQAQEESPHV